MELVSAFLVDVCVNGCVWVWVDGYMCVGGGEYGCEWMGGGERCGCVSGGVGMGVSGWVCVAMGASGCMCGCEWMGMGVCGCVAFCCPCELMPVCMYTLLYVHLTVCTPYWSLRTVIHQNSTFCLVLCIVLTAFYQLVLYKLLLLKSSSLMGTGSQMHVGVTLLDASIKLPVGFEQLFLAQCNRSLHSSHLVSFSLAQWLTVQTAHHLSLCWLWCWFGY